MKPWKPSSCCKKYGGVVIGLALDENGIPPKAEQRFEIAKRLLTKQKNMALTKDIIIDCLVLTASAQQKKSWKQSKLFLWLKHWVSILF